MKSRLFSVAAGLLLPALAQGQTQNVLTNPAVRYDSRHDVSVALRDMASEDWDTRIAAFKFDDCR